MGKLEIIEQRELLGKQFTIYGTIESPLFLAKDIAEYIDYAKTGNGAYDISKMLATVDEGEKLIRKLFVSGQMRDVWFLNEDGLYELLMQSRKPIAKQFKKKVKEILKTIRKTGTYSIPDLTATSRPRYRARMINTAIKDVASTAKTLMKMFAVKEGIAQATAFNMVESAYGLDMSPIKQIIPAAKHEIGWLTPTELGMRMGGRKAAIINKMLADLKLQCQELGAKGKKIWRLTDLGKNYGEEFPYDAKTGHSGYQIKWNENVLSLLKMEVGAAI